MLVDKLQVIEDKFMDLEQRISDPEVIARQDEWRKLTVNMLNYLKPLKRSVPTKKFYLVLMKLWKLLKINPWTKNSEKWLKRN